MLGHMSECLGASTADVSMMRTAQPLDLNVASVSKSWYDTIAMNHFESKHVVFFTARACSYV